MKKIFALLLAAMLLLSSVALCEVERNDNIVFNYDENVFEITMDDHTEDEDLIILSATDEAWGDTFIRFQLGKMGEGVSFPTAEEMAEAAEAEVTQGDWNGFKDVLMYTVNYEDYTENNFVVPIAGDDGVTKSALYVQVGASTIDDDETAMARDDQISAVLDSLKIGMESSVYTQADIDEAIGVIEQEFATWEGCVMHAIRYAGDECNTQENIDWLNSLEEGKDYVQCIEFLSDIHSPLEGDSAWELDTEYTDYQWWLGRVEGGSWELVSWGY